MSSRTIRMTDAIDARLMDDRRIELCMLPVGDGLTIARKLP